MLDALQWRYATKVFDAQKKLTPEQIDLLFEAIRLSPSSFGLQPWRVVVIADTEMREKLRQAAYGQSQITDASHLIVFVVKNNLSEKDVDGFIALMAQEQKTSLSELEKYAHTIKQSLIKRSEKENTEWAIRQAYIALGVLLTVAAHESIDVCPMEGFDATAFDEVLDLKEKNFTTCVIAPIGFRSEQDKAAQLPKVRFSKEQFILKNLS